MANNNMRTVSVSFDPNRLSLAAMTDVLLTLGALRELAEEHEDMLIINEVMAQEEAIDRLPKQRRQYERRAPRAEESRPTEQETAHDTMVKMDQAMLEGLSEGQQGLLQQINKAGKVLTRAEIADMFPEQRGATIGTWLHSLEKRGLIASERSGEGTEQVTTYRIAMAPVEGEMADA